MSEVGTPWAATDRFPTSLLLFSLPNVHRQHLGGARRCRPYQHDPRTHTRQRAAVRQFDFERDRPIRYDQRPENLSRDPANEAARRDNPIGWIGQPDAQPGGARGVSVGVDQMHLRRSAGTRRLAHARRRTVGTGTTREVVLIRRHDTTSMGVRVWSHYWGIGAFYPFPLLVPDEHGTKNYTQILQNCQASIYYAYA